jgi:glycosyltransferase involved in cell wall biosynthesis
MKSLIIDGQMLQTDAWHRGMGRYVLQVLRQLNNKAEEVEVAMLFNSNLQCDESRFETIKYLYPNIKQYREALPLASKKYVKPEAYKRALDDFVNREFSGKDTSFLITSLFLFDFFAEFPANCHKLLIFYDLIPLEFWQDLGGYFPPELYMARFKSLYEAEVIFAISETTRKDLLKEFGLPPELVVNVNGGFTRIAEVTKRPVSFKVPDNYILFPTGDLPHKNNDVAVKGFDEYVKRNGSQTRLLVTSSFSEDSKKRLRTLSDKVVFTNNVSDEELEWLYQNAAMVLFASKYEGLGLPILDAVANKKPIITSKVLVFQEMSEQAFYFFDPANPDDLAAALEMASDHNNFAAKLPHYPAIMEKYTWTNTATAILEHIPKGKPAELKYEDTSKPKIAVVSIQPAIAGQIGRAAEALYFCLRQEFEVDYYFDANGVHFRDMERPTFLDYLDCKAMDINQLNIESYRKYKSVIYLLDNAAFPSRLAQRAAVLPGIAVTGKLPKMDAQNEMLKTVVLNNQYDHSELNVTGFKAYKQLTEKLSKQISKSPQGRPETAIFKRRSRRAIIRELKASHGL